MIWHLSACILNAIWKQHKEALYQIPSIRHQPLEIALGNTGPWLLSHISWWAHNYFIFHYPDVPVLEHMLFVVCLGHISKQSACRLYYPIIHCMFQEIMWSCWFFRYRSFKLSKLTLCHVSLLLFPVKDVLDLQVQVWLNAAVCSCHKGTDFPILDAVLCRSYIFLGCANYILKYTVLPPTPHPPHPELNSVFCSWKLNTVVLYKIKLSITSDLWAIIFFRCITLSRQISAFRHRSERQVTHKPWLTSAELPPTDLLVQMNSTTTTLHHPCLSTTVAGPQ